MEDIVDVLASLEQTIRKRTGTHVEHSDPKVNGDSNLLPDRHPVRDFFVADVLDWALKVDRQKQYAETRPGG
jgi:hypothetical protein